jgi:hypothetical protein
VQPPLLQAFPFPSTLGEVTLHPLSQSGVFIYSSHGKWVFPPLLWSFPPKATFTSFPAPGCWVCAAAAAFSSWLVVRDFPSLPPSLAPLCYMSFFCYCLFSVFFLFSLGVGWSVQGATLVWPRVVCGSTTCRLAHLVVHILPSHLGAAVRWWRGSPPGFSIQCEVEMLCAGWRCGGVKVLPLLGGFSCKVYLQSLSEVLL